jgi:adenylate cyclase
MSYHRRTADPIVLLVDDEPGILNAVRRALRNERVEVLTAGSSDEALGWLEELPVDLIIADQRMPGMSGVELLHEVRKRYPRTARAMLTGYRTPSTIRKGVDAGAETFLYKPWNDQVLVDTVRQLLNEWPRDKAAPPGPATAG